ncbi:MAG: nucleotidyltransferase domain-containing protein [Candidatus Peregrinibacteria bacterium]|nr:nucleotidyltransferase domain-containing protein [Candidatus Peregrinibacteria bacterium]MDZ4244478.1 nucleotidyltransferase domain-containing protein [Candidatus Gracilibacteria bacterium]
MKKFGLTANDIEDLKNSFQRFGKINKVVIFGSRAIGNHKPYSDVDLAIVEGKVGLSDQLRVLSKIEEETNLPYFVDLLDYNSITNENLKKHIDTHGKVIYKKK